MTEAEYEKACSMAYGIGRYMGDPSAERDIVAVAKEARLQTLRAEMLEACISLSSAEDVVREKERLEYHMATSADRDAVVEAKRVYDEARKAWMLMGGRE